MAWRFAGAVGQARRKAAAAPALKEREAGFQRYVIDLAERNGWLVYHIRDSRAVVNNATGAGFPDLVMAHPTRTLLVIAELKQDRRYPRANQRTWLAALGAVAALVPDGRVRVEVWRPKDRPMIERFLRGTA